MAEAKSTKKHIMTVDVSQMYDDNGIKYMVKIQAKNTETTMNMRDPAKIADYIMERFYLSKSMSNPPPNPYIVNVVDRDNNPTISNNGYYDK